jgi:ABC-type nitrate/sulfonate/bicarbonate transport system ATPase subunit
MLRVIADLQQPSSGTLLVNGMTAENARRGRCYGYVFQAPALFPWRTIEKNLKLPLEVMGFSRNPIVIDHPVSSITQAEVESRAAQVALQAPKVWLGH